MRFRGRRRSAHLEDRRGAGGGFGGGRRRGRGGAVAGGGGLIAVIFVVLALFAPAELRPILAALAGEGGEPVFSEGPSADAPDDEISEFVAVALADTEDFWRAQFDAGAVPTARGAYRESRLVLFQGQTSSQCGPASAATGPFYCPADQSIYIDPAFFRVMAEQLGAEGDFAQAYVIAHEVAHHVQNLAGVLQDVHRRSLRLSETDANQLTVRVELQADCFAGAWARALERRGGILERGDLDEALTAAFSVGDDVLMRMSGQRVDPTQFTHGTGEQRRRWFNVGWDSGSPADCDTFDQDFRRL